MITGRRLHTIKIIFVFRRCDSSLFNNAILLWGIFFCPLWYHKGLVNDLIHKATNLNPATRGHCQCRTLPLRNQVPPPWQQQVDQAQDGGAASHRQPSVEPHLHLLRPAARRPQQRLPGAHRVGQRGPGQQRLSGRSAARSRNRCASSAIKGKDLAGILKIGVVMVVEWCILCLNVLRRNLRTYNICKNSAASTARRYGHYLEH